MTYTFTVYKSLYDKELKKLDKEIKRIRTNKKIDSRTKVVEIGKIQRKRETYISDIKTNYDIETSKTDMKINFLFQKLKKGQDTLWTIGDISFVEGGSHNAGQIWLKAVLERLDKTENSLEINLIEERASWNEKNLAQKTINLPLNLAITESDKSTVDMDVKYKSYLGWLSYKDKSKEYFYWTNAEEVTAQFVKELQKRLN
jgi:hypothetical protein